MEHYQARVPPCISGIRPDIRGWTTHSSRRQSIVSDTDTLLEFPCDFPIKAMGLAVEGFDLQVTELVRRHAPDLGEGAVRT
ncbi:MAG: DUF493 domain-containing protein, partial [Xanthomonadaceae bacterium]|nr:DUF493 domain-containing protein [Xanthomonadaceae bacterium]